MAYPTMAALVAASSGDARAALDALDDAQKEALRDAAIVGVEDFCGQTFGGSVDKTVIIDGNGANRLYLPERLEALTRLEVAGSALSAADVRVSDAGDALELAAFTGGNAYTRAMATIDPDYSAGRRRFVRGTGTIAITGTWGWSEPPDGVALALRYDLEDNALADSHALAASIHAYRTLGLRDISQGNLRATVQDTPGLSARAIRRLQRYVWQAAGVRV